LKEKIRKLEKKYKYKDWWREMTRETNGSGQFLISEETRFLEEWLPISEEADYDEGDIPF